MSEQGSEVITEEVCYGDAPYNNTHCVRADPEITQYDPLIQEGINIADIAKPKVGDDSDGDDSHNADVVVVDVVRTQTIWFFKVEGFNWLVLPC